MAFPTIVFSSSSGTSQASGAGPATAITGTAASNGAGNVVNLDGSPDLSGVAADGSHAIWIQTASGRRLSKITAVDDLAKTVTTEDTFTLAGTEDWAIGGKLVDVDGVETDLKDGWTYQLEAGTYTPTGTITLTNSSTDRASLIGAGAGQTIIDMSGTGAHGINGSGTGRALISNLTIYNESARYGIRVTGMSDVVIDGVEVDGSHNLNTSHGVLVSTTLYGIFRNLHLHDMSSGSGIAFNSGRLFLSIEGCVIENCSGAGILASGVTPLNHVAVLNCIITGCNIGIENTTAGLDALTVRGCSIYGCTSHGISFGGYSDQIGAVRTIANCLFVSNGGYGVSGGASSGNFLDYCGFYGNTSGEISSTAEWQGLSNNVTLTGDPFTDAANGDFSPNNTAGAGAACRAAGWPGAFPGGLTTGYRDIGAAQHQDSGGGGATTRAYAI